jgi:amidase
LKKIDRRNTFQMFGQEGFVASVEPGERFCVEATRSSRAPTGPIEVTGAAPNDVLAVKVHRIALEASGAVWARPGAGLLGEELYDHIHEAAERVRPIAINGEFAEFGDGLRIRLRPMVGVIGVAPPGPGTPTTWPGRHGGNLDCGLMVPGATIYLPIYRPGAGLGIGDVHGRMGDGEVMTSGLEIEADIEVEVIIHRNMKISGPIIELPDRIAFLASAKTLEAAGTLALMRAVRAVRAKTGLDFVAAGMLMSLIGDLGIAQAVNPRVTAQFVIHKDDLALDLLVHHA